MEENIERLVNKEPESIFHNMVFYSFIGIMGFTFIAIVGYLIYSIF